MNMYSQEDGVTFGYKKQEKDTFKYNILENYKYGRFCKSGLAKIITDKNEMMCVTMTKLETNKGKDFLLSNKCNTK